jgi:hypothetical protein
MKIHWTLPSAAADMKNAPSSRGFIRDVTRFENNDQRPRALAQRPSKKLNAQSGKTPPQRNISPLRADEMFLSLWNFGGRSPMRTSTGLLYK